MTVLFPDFGSVRSAMEFENQKLRKIFRELHPMHESRLRFLELRHSVSISMTHNLWLIKQFSLKMKFEVEKLKNFMLVSPIWNLEVFNWSWRFVPIHFLSNFDKNFRSEMKTFQLQVFQHPITWKSSTFLN